MKSPNRTIRYRNIHDQWHRVPVGRIKSFRPSVYGVIIRNRKVLLSKQWDGYDFPGGGMNFGETITQALIREVKEETGLRVKAGQLITVTDSFFKFPNRKGIHQCLLMFYTCRVVGGRISTKYFAGYEKTYANLAEWLDIKQVKHLKFYNPVDSPKIIKQAAKVKNQRQIFRPVE